MVNLGSVFEQYQLCVHEYLKSIKEFCIKLDLDSVSMLFEEVKGKSFSIYGETELIGKPLP